MSQQGLREAETRTCRSKPGLFLPSAKQGWGGPLRSILNFIFQDKPGVSSSVILLLCCSLMWDHTPGIFAC